MPSNSRPVYSTSHGSLCRECGRGAGLCICKRPAPRPKGDGIVRVSRESKGRAGKGVTLVTGLPLDDDALAKLAGELKKRCGSGGTVKDGVIEIQGEQRDLLVAELARRGFTVKKAGG